MYSRNCTASVPIPTFICLWLIYIFPGSAHIFGYSKIDNNEAAQFNFWESINGNQIFILDSHRPFIYSVVKLTKQLSKSSELFSATQSQLISSKIFNKLPNLFVLQSPTWIGFDGVKNRRSKISHLCTFFSQRHGKKRKKERQNTIKIAHFYYHSTSKSHTKLLIIKKRLYGVSQNKDLDRTIFAIYLISFTPCHFNAHFSIPRTCLQYLTS
jgi:hypothetical protein